MLFLRALEFAFGGVVISFISWQIVAPLLMGQKPFPLFRAEEPVPENTKLRSVPPTPSPNTVKDKVDE